MKQYWLVTSYSSNRSYPYKTYVIDKHPVEMFKEGGRDSDESLLFALEITEEQFHDWSRL